MKSNTAARLRELMQFYSIRQIDIANRTGIDKAVISQYLSGKRLPRQDKVSIICDCFNINEAWLMGFEVEMLRKPEDMEERMTAYYEKFDGKESEISEISKMLRNKSEEDIQLVKAFVSKLPDVQ